MKAPEESSLPAVAGPVVIGDVRRAQVVTDRNQLRRLAPFMGAERTVAQAAARLGLGIPAMYKLVTRFVALGLLQETRREARAGRAIRHYRAAPAFFVPFEVMPLGQIGLQNRRVHLDRFERSLAAAMREGWPPGWGTLTCFTPSGEAYYEIASAQGERFDPLDLSSPVLLSGWNLLTLTPQEARALQRQLAQVITPYLGRTGGGETYLLGTFLCRDQGDR
ncbi:hypothetical protein DEIPH_ctg012orf0107 [Deinococcus phoenicis]|uniref:HTH iclR-type domain-containing protein n=1 Tax=Deinococcus phoenicis TaxID=1476583 RepID=A0A016QT55_9DEIO|nr:hypothetical protein [Deinococcus phoenicis]EYB69032.1 hypothetical protein DEIPH_ctg012orf0107 [Deinococcus phoenicis]